MKSEIKKLPKSQVEITVEVPVKEVQPFLEQAAEKISKEIKLDGFRPGKAPYNVIKEKVGEMEILKEALDSIIGKTYREALEEHKILSLGQPQVDVEKMAPGNNIVYKATVAVLPKVKLGDIKTVKVTRKKVEVKGDQVEKVLADIQKMRAKETLVKREAKKGDRLEIDFDIYLDKVPIENFAHKKYPITIGEDRFIPGFEEKITGMKTGDEKKFELKFPEKYHAKNLAGKNAEFKVKCLAVYEIELPKLDDKFAKEISNKQFKTVDELKENIQKNIEQEEKTKEEQRLEIEILDKLVEISEFEDEVPDTLIDNEAKKMMQELEHNISSQGMKFEDYLKSLKKKRDEFEKDLRPQAEKRAKTSIIAREVFQEQGFAVDDGEIEKEIETMKKNYPAQPEVEKQLESENYKEYMRHVIGNRKVIKFLKKEILS